MANVEGQEGTSQTLPGTEAWPAQAALLQLLSMLGEQADFEESDVEEDEWESVGEGDEEEEEEEEEEGPNEHEGA